MMPSSLIQHRTEARHSGRLSPGSAPACLEKSFALCCVKPLCNASRDRFEQASRNMNSQMDDDRAGHKSGLRQPLLFKGKSIRPVRRRSGSVP